MSVSPCGEEMEQESHLLAGRCKVYGDIREKYGELEDEEDLVSFFMEVLERREELESLYQGTRGLEGQDTLGRARLAAFALSD